MDKLLDTSVIVEIFGGNKKVIESLSPNETYAIPTIVLFELYCGNLKEREVLMLEMIPKVEFNEEAAKIAGWMFQDLKEKGKLPPLKDLLIAATAIAHDMTLITCDRDFEMFKEYGLKVKILEIC
ncbi:nucleic acid-binding protein [Pyrococcus sp. NA2]|uniref:type II toxin-antitoxin system VapC family toxin n=1 Tax=Pyrococcus sp. (strain NA2) TaxID=342949 RepID=UPI000209A989|nr:type II toxin-antitoxin system VapC family toxin [Pyrococcus sp. NA2]AEC51895.1 nucleic acid-binding protein [Pyrococcus sp. NA2]